MLVELKQRAEGLTYGHVKSASSAASGLYDMEGLTDRQEVTLTTPFGAPSGPYVTATLRGRRVAFLARHGAGHRILADAS